MTSDLRYCKEHVVKELCDGGWFVQCRWTIAYCGGQGPSPRSSHAAAIHNKSFIVLGGQSKGEVFADCYLLDLNNLIWHQVACLLPGQAITNCWTL